MGPLAFYISASWVGLSIMNQMDSSLSPAASTELDPRQTLTLSSKCRMTTYHLLGHEPRPLYVPSPLCYY